MTPIPRVKAVLFDLDGTLVDSLPTIAEAMAEAARMHRLDASAEQIVPFIGAPMNILVEEIYGVSPELANAVNEDYVRVYHGGYVQQTPAH